MDKDVFTVALSHLAVALGVGLIVGLQRGWSDRAELETGRVAGLRSFGLIGLSGGLCALLAQIYGGAILPIGLVAVVAILFLIDWMRGEQGLDRITALAAVATFALGAVAVAGQPLLAGAGAVVTAWLLGLKVVLHRWLQRIEEQELWAALQLLLVTLVVLPLLPDRGFGPYEAINPYNLWWLVILIAGISFLGYIAMKAFGTERGTLLASLAGGLVSSTATTLSLARAGRGLPELHRSLAAGVLLASTVMAPRVVVIGVAVEPRLLVPLGIPMGLVALAGIATVAVLARGSRKAPPPAVQSANPFALGMAIKLALVIAVVILLSRALYQWLGDAGLLIVSTISGVTDVDAVTVSSSRLVREGVSIALATGSILVAVLSNTIAKAAYVASIAGGPMARLVALGFLLQILVGAAGLALVVRVTTGGP
jgi:uncharacterized membrane protein (DUF4010 family)